MSVLSSAELRLVAACCRWPPSAQRDVNIRVAAAVVDWEGVERVTARHRVTPLVYDGLRRSGVVIPAGAEQRLSASAAAAAQSSLSLAPETMRLQAAFDDAKIPAAFVKGATIEVLAYGSLGKKQSVDIDLLTSPESATVARRMLCQIGYEAVYPARLDDSGFDRFKLLAKEASFFHPQLRTFVDLHWRLANNSMVLPGIGVHSGHQIVPIGGVLIRTLDDESLYAYLTVHGTAHSWSRLKWLADLNAFLAGRAEAEIERLHRAAIDMGAETSSGTALLLCCDLFELSSPTRLMAELQASIRTRMLRAHSFGMIGHGGGQVGIGSNRSIPGLRMMLAPFLMSSGASHWWCELRALGLHPEDQSRVPLPRGPSFFLVRLPLWVARFAARMIGKAKARHQSDRR